MGKIVRRKTKKINSENQQGKNKKSKKRSTISNVNVKRKKTNLSKNNMKNSNENVSSTTEIIEIEDSFTSSNIPLSTNNDFEVIDITDTTVIENNSKNYIRNNTHLKSTVHSDNDDVQIISHTLFENHKPIQLIILSDSEDDEMQKIQKPTKPIISNEFNNSNKISKNKYISPLRHCNKIVSNQQSYLGIPLSQDGFVALNDRKGHPFHSKNPMHNRFTSTATTLTSLPTISTTSIAKKKLRPIIIDGLNVGHAHSSSKEFSVKGIELCVEFFANRGHKEIIAFIPQHRQGMPGSQTHTTLQKLHEKGFICWTPSRKVQNLRMTCYDDRIILDYAHKCGGVVVSNDNYRDLYNESEAFKDIIENRHVMITFVRDLIIVPEDQYNRKSNIRSLSDILCFPDAA